MTDVSGAPGARPISPREHDESLLAGVRRGDPAGVAGLFDLYSGRLLRFTDRMLGNRAEAEEVTQEVFLKVIQRVDQYDGSAPVASWLFAIAANACRDRLRRARTRKFVPDEALAERPASITHEDDRLVKEERRRAVREALAGLTGEQREAIVLARYHGLPYAEIARTLGTTEGAVKTRIFRAMETLKTRLGGIS